MSRSDEFFHPRHDGGVELVEREEEDELDERGEDLALPGPQNSDVARQAQAIRAQRQQRTYTPADGADGADGGGSAPGSAGAAGASGAGDEQPAATIGARPVRSSVPPPPPPPSPPPLFDAWLPAKDPDDA